jgi:farnesyl-diphosphate farnesyltransferase
MSAAGQPPAETAAGLWDIYTLGPLRRTYLTVTMDRVSRSFALVVPWLEDPLQDHMATAYLLCRVLDNIEDCSEPVAWRRERLAEFVELLADPGLAPHRIAEWSAAPWPGLSDDERALMTLEGGLPLWLIFATFPPRTRSIFRNWIPMMARGMEAVFDPAPSGAVVLRQQVRMLATAEDYNDYCYSVAGTVGGMGTELVVDHYGLSPRRARLLLRGSEACGRALQKTNVLKDFVEDLRRRVCFLPDEWLREIDHRPLGLAGAPLEWVSRLLGDILVELRESTRYVLEVPREAAGYRIACLMCLLPAYETILSAVRSQAALFTPAHDIKISRSAIARCIHRAVAFAADDDAIGGFSRDFERRILETLGGPEPVLS